MSFDLLKLVVKAVIVLVLVAVLAGLIYWLLVASQWS